MRQTELSLSKADRRAVQAFRSKGAHMAREFNRAHILAALDRGVPERQIMDVLGVGRTAIWRTRAAYLEGGLALALHDLARPASPSDMAETRKPKLRRWPAPIPQREPNAGLWGCSPEPRASTRRCARSAARASAGC